LQATRHPPLATVFQWHPQERGVQAHEERLAAVIFAGVPLARPWLKVEYCCVACLLPHFGHAARWPFARITSRSKRASHSSQMYS
jgi:hypothetical protein